MLKAEQLEVGKVYKVNKIVMGEFTSFNENIVLFKVIPETTALSGDGEICGILRRNPFTGEPVMFSEVETSQETGQTYDPVNTVESNHESETEENPFNHDLEDPCEACGINREELEQKLSVLSDTLNKAHFSTVSQNVEVIYKSLSKMELAMGLLIAERALNS